MNNLNAIDSVENPSVSAAPPQKPEPSETDKLIGGALKRMGFRQLIGFANHPYLDRVPSSEMSKHSWSLENWALWSRQVVETMEKKLSYEQAETIRDIFDRKIVKQNPQCPPGTLSQIVKAMGTLQTPGNFFVDWMFANALQNIGDFSPVELYQFIHGASKLASNKQLRPFLEAISFYYDEDTAKLQKLKNDLDPHGIACILKAYNACKVQGKLSNALLELADEKYASFDYYEQVDLIAGLDPILFSEQNKIKALKLLGQIEDSLSTRKGVSDTTLSIALEHFVLSRYVPLKLIPVINQRLQDPRVDIYTKFTLLCSTARLGLKEEYGRHFKSLLPFLYEVSKKGRPNYETMYPKDIIHILHAAAVFLDPANQGLITPDLVSHICVKAQSLDKKEKITLTRALEALHFNDEVIKIKDWVHKRKVPSHFPAEITEAVETWLKEYGMPSHSLTFKTAFENQITFFKIQGFDKIGLPNQKDLAFTLDDFRYFACNVPKHRLGRSIVRDRHLERRSYEFRAFCEDTSGVADVITFLDQKLKTDWKDISV